MASEEVIKLEWEQLPQRSAWPDPSVPLVMNELPSQAELRASKFAPQTAGTPAEKQRGGWEYLDHTADVQIHAWGVDLGDAFGAAVVGMSAYMVEIDEIEDNLETQIVASGHDMQSLLYNFMDECLYIFHTESFVTKQVVVRELDLQKFSITVTARGGTFDASRHSQGTEVKAITYSNMQVITSVPGKAEIYVIVDI